MILCQLNLDAFTLEHLQVKYGIVMPAMVEMYEMYEMSSKSKSSENIRVSGFHKFYFRLYYSEYKKSYSSAITYE
jgi:hypothetical protein